MPEAFHAVFENHTFEGRRLVRSVLEFAPLGHSEVEIGSARGAARSPLRLRRWAEGAARAQVEPKRESEDVGSAHLGNMPIPRPINWSMGANLTNFAPNLAHIDKFGRTPPNVAQN